jgi:hypothetical protein
MRGDPTIASAGVAKSADLAASEAAAMWGIAAPTLLRRGGNAVYLAGEHIIRVSPDLVGAARQRALADWLEERDYPVLCASDGLIGTVNGLDVMAVRRVDTSGQPDLELVGRSLARLHGEDVVEVESVMGTELAVMFPGDVEKTYQRLVADGLSDEFDEQGLANCLMALGSAVTLLVDRGWDNVFVHGDCQATNVLAGADGTWLIDFELACRAPRWWDLAMLTMFAKCFDENGWWNAHLGELYLAYGEVDFELLEAWTTYALVATTAGCIAKRNARPELGAEAHVRLQWWAGYVDAPVWHFL